MNSIEAPRPLNLGEILDRTVQLYRDRFLVYLGIAIIPTGTLLILGGGIFLGLAWIGERAGKTVAPINSATAAAIGFAVLAVISLPVFALLLGVSPLSAAAMNHAAEGSLAGRRPTIRGSFGAAWQRGWQYVWLYFLQSLIVWGAPLVLWFAAFALLTGLLVGGGRGAAGQAAGALVGLSIIFGLTLVAAYALWMLLCVSLAFPGCVVEKIGAWKALRRSFRLSKGTRGRIFVLYLLGYVLGSIVSMVAFVILVILIALVPALNSPQNSQMMGMGVLFLIYGSSFAVKAFTKPVYAIALMLFYYDQRIRKEGFDIEWMMERAGLMPGGAAAPIGESRPGSNAEPAVGANGEFVATMNGEPLQEPGADSVAIPVEMESVPKDEIPMVAHAEAAEQLAEAGNTTEATQPAGPTPSENRVQG